MPTLKLMQTLCCHFLHQTHSKASPVINLLQVIHVSLSSLSNENAGEVEFPLDGLTPLIFGMVNSFSICYNEQQHLYACRTKRKGVSAETNIQYSNSRVSRDPYLPCVLISLACQTVCVGAANKLSGHCCTHSGTTAGMLAEPTRSLRGLCDETNTNNSNS